MTNGPFVYKLIFVIIEMPPRNNSGNSIKATHSEHNWPWKQLPTHYWLSQLKRSHVIYLSEMFLNISAMVFITVTDTRLNARMCLDEYNFECTTKILRLALDMNVTYISKRDDDMKIQGEKHFRYYNNVSAFSGCRFSLRIILFSKEMRGGASIGKKYSDGIRLDRRLYICCN